MECTRHYGICSLCYSRKDIFDDVSSFDDGSISQSAKCNYTCKLNLIYVHSLEYFQGEARPKVVKRGIDDFDNIEDGE